MNTRSRRRATIVEVRTKCPEDGEFFAACTWVAIDSAGRNFYGDSEAEARELAEQYNAPRRLSPRAAAGAPA